MILAALTQILGAFKRQAGEQNPATVFLLRHLRESSGVRISELAEASRLDASTVSRHVKALEESSYVSRVEDPEDGRACLVQITGRGRDLYDAAMAARLGALDRALSDWPERDRSQLSGLMDRLAKDLTHPHDVRSSL